MGVGCECTGVTNECEEGWSNEMLGVKRVLLKKELTRCMDVYCTDS